MTTKDPEKTDVQFPPPQRGLPGDKPLPVFLPDFESPGGGFDRIHTEVQTINELKDWLDQSAELEMTAGLPIANDPDITGVLSIHKLDHLKSVAKSGEHEEVAAAEQVMVSGSLGEFSLMDLLQLFAAGGRTGLLACTDGQDTSRVFLEGGTIMGATWNEDKKIDGLQSLKHAASMVEGLFFFGPSNTDAPEPKKPMSMLQVALAVAPPPGEEFDSMETFPGFDFEDSSQLGKMAGAPFPGVDETAPEVDLSGQLSDDFSPVLPMAPKLRDLSPEELDVFQLALNGMPLNAIAMGSGMDEARCRPILEDLVARGYLKRG